MRIIGGLFKGKLITSLRNSNTRPLRDAVKENIFNILLHSKIIKINLTKSNVLDVYSGIGSFGLECLSRGARKVSFVESDKLASKILKENIQILSQFDKSSVYNEKLENFLKNEKEEKYNIFFFDPPFSDKTFIENLNQIKKNEIFKKNHLIIIHRESKTEDKLDDYMDTILTRRYGRSKIIFGLFN